MTEVIRMDAQTSSTWWPTISLEKQKRNETVCIGWPQPIRNLHHHCNQRSVVCQTDLIELRELVDADYVVG